MRRTAILTAPAAYIGTIVGAGFASRQEVLQFFRLPGPWGLPAAAIAVACFAYFGYAVANLYGFSARQTRERSPAPRVATISAGPGRPSATDRAAPRPPSPRNYFPEKETGTMTSTCSAPKVVL